MKKLLLMAAAVATLAVTAQPAAAQYPAGPVMQAGGCTQCDGGSGYGGHMGGKLKGGFGFGFLSGIFTNHGGHGGGGPRDIPVVDPRSGNAGQLVFPQNPFIRGPRDYFMWDER
jgi:opacity protein-like surface antigen